MLVTTTNTLEGYQITDYVGVVSGETILGANVVRDFMASLTDFFGGRSGTYEGKLAEAREIAIQEMQEQARRKGADAVIGVDLDFETIGGMLMCIATGTAVRINK
ncbi:YbjQ family protein [Thermoactinomyces sp. DSM 45892]|uniref:YbjQ family protein n=1 Tax=Thermoactinomyces sp. DSM 45892 TaxID=1882753 RepID=UPI0008948FF7|nr:YbjQ family protein [Thermoactinomyces sp. DSM 45892]SDZ17570.1 Uncharacterized conserved protein YbjQ, UPF0145 family [Thermoactinomyces sp. DSM 45892]